MQLTHTSSKHAHKRVSVCRLLADRVCMRMHVGTTAIDRDDSSDVTYMFTCPASKCPSATLTVQLVVELAGPQRPEVTKCTPTRLRTSTSGPEST